MKKHLALFLSLTLLFIFIAHTRPNVEAAGPIWADDFDSYPTGFNLHGVGGWKGWFNDPAFTAFTADLQYSSGINSVDISYNSDLVHEYTYAGGLFNYRFTQYIPSNMVGTSYFSMLNQYDDTGAANNWSVQVQFQSATGLMIDDGAAGSSMPYIPNQWVEVCLEIDLDNDTQAFYYNDQVFYEGTWSNHVSDGGITAIGAVNLFANGASSIYYDDMSLSTGHCSTELSYIYLPIIQSALAN